MIPIPDATQVGDFWRARTGSGLELYLLATDKFKTRQVRFHFRAPLGPANAARALVPSMLRRGSRQHQSLVEVSRALEELYGASWSSSAHKVGGELVLSFRLDVVDERLLPGSPRILAPALELAREFLLEPLLENDSFLPAIFEQERRNLEREIEAQFNDKLALAFQRLLLEMYPGDSYGLPVLGTRDEARALTRAQVDAAWREAVARWPARIYLIGDFEVQPVREWFDRTFAFPSAPPAVPQHTRPSRAPTREVIEQDAVSQSKLLIGHEVDLQEVDARQYDALRVLVSILGGGFHSRLFQKVREERSLAYSVGAGIDRIKGFLYVSAGIDAAHRREVQELVAEELASLQRAAPQPQELELARRLLVTSARSSLDAPGSMVDLLETSLASGQVRTLAELCESLEAVTAADVLAAAARITPPRVIYCLEGEARA